MIRFICARNSFFFVFACASSSLITFSVICLYICLFFHVLPAFATVRCRLRIVTWKSRNPAFSAKQIMCFCYQAAVWVSQSLFSRFCEKSYPCLHPVSMRRSIHAGAIWMAAWAIICLIERVWACTFAEQSSAFLFPEKSLHLSDPVVQRLPRTSV